MRLLWVENHSVFVRIAGRQFLASHEVTVVSSLAGARQALAEQTFDAILLDYDLDDGKGTDLFDFLRPLAKRPVVVATSARTDGNEALVQAGADSVCGKPNFGAIDSVLRRAIDAQSREG